MKLVPLISTAGEGRPLPLARRWPRAALICCLLALGGWASAEPASLHAGTGSFAYELAGKHVPVWYFVPAGDVSATPVVFVMHGLGRSARTYRDDWVPHAERSRFILLCPEFSEKEFPGDSGYNFGNTVDPKGRPLPREAWSFNMIEPIFDLVRQRLGNRSETYSLYGHSAGAQFVHRFLYFVPNARVLHVVSANAGWYTLPGFGTDFPYGLGKSAVSPGDLKRALQRPLVILLGTADTDPKQENLRQTPEAEAQGPYRLARGRNFFSRGEAEARLRGLPFGWRIDYAPGVAHTDRGMAPYAIRWLVPSVQ